MHRRLLFALALYFLFVFAPLSVYAAPGNASIVDNVVNDVTALNPVKVDRVITPHSIEEIQNEVRSHDGFISIGGGRFSMGGQTATEGALFIDTKEFNRILSFSTSSKTITVEPGITWRKIQEHIDPYDLSVSIMQTYSNFTVGGSLSVNVHGRYIGKGPVILSVQSIKLVLADGTLVEASPNTNSDLFFAAIGGYGGVGVIVEATLLLDDNVKVKRETRVMPIGEYRDYFVSEVRDNPDVIFHNGDIYPPKYDTVRPTNWVKTDSDTTEDLRLIPADRSYKLNQFFMYLVTELPWGLGKKLRQYVLDPWIYRNDAVEWRNFEASYDVRELEPYSRDATTYVLQEYFVPVDRFDEFVPKMRDIFTARDVNVVNVSIRHALPDPGSHLAWARGEVFAFVVYYKQGTDPAAKEAVSVWTKEMTDAALSVGGSYYLPYQPWATNKQFRAAYPNAQAFFDVKARVDPTDKFQNKLWDAYYPGNEKAALRALREEAAEDAAYVRPEVSTFLTFPEWFIVYASKDYDDWKGKPSGFPYLSEIKQFWQTYAAMYGETKRSYAFNWENHLMIGVIGVSFTIENGILSLYENTIGRLTELSSYTSPEDQFGAAIWKDYTASLYVAPWYEYPFFDALKMLWIETPLWSDTPVRSWERKLSLSLAYIVKGIYAKLIGYATHAVYERPILDTRMLVKASSPEGLATIRLFKGPEGDVVADTPVAIALPRYQPFTEAVLALARGENDFQILDISGNDEILVSVIAPEAWAPPSGARVLFSLPHLLLEGRVRVGLIVRVSDLLPVVRELEGERVELEHIYDY